MKISIAFAASLENNHDIATMFNSGHFLLFFFSFSFPHTLSNLLYGNKIANKTKVTKDKLE